MPGGGASSATGTSVGDHLLSRRTGARPRDVHRRFKGGPNAPPEREVVVQDSCAVEQPQPPQEDAREGTVGRRRDTARDDREERVVAIVVREVDLAAKPHAQPLVVERGREVVALPQRGRGRRGVVLRRCEHVRVVADGARELRGMHQAERQPVRQHRVGLGVGVPNRDQASGADPARRLLRSPAIAITGVIGSTPAGFAHDASAGTCAIARSNAMASRRTFHSGTPVGTASSAAKVPLSPGNDAYAR